MRASEARRRPLLCLVTDRARSRRPLGEAVRLAVAAGVDWVQVRERGLSGRALLELTDGLVEASRRGAEESRREVRVLVNRRIDVALAAAADGIHLGFDALPVEPARRLVGDRALVGVSTHAPEEVGEAAGRGASYAHLAPIFAPLSKAGDRPPLGPEAVRRARRFGLPVLAQGGIEADRVDAVLRAGAAGVAVTGAILMQADPAAAAARLREALDRSAAALARPS